MKQVIQSFRTGELALTEVPAPVLRPRGILVRTVASLISAGTERMVLEFAEKNLLQKAQSRPDLVRRVVDKVKAEGVLATYESARSRLDQPLPLGYSSAGVVVETGSEANAFRVGDRVACAGGGYACHAEVVYIPRNLAVRIPDTVSFEAAAFTTVGAVALQGIRQASIQLGDNVAVIGLGLLGQLAVQVLKAAGGRVFGIDLNPARVTQALRVGADGACITETAETSAQEFTHGRGFDAVIITADTRSNDPVCLAGDIARDRAVVVAVGAVGMEIPRKAYYDKELDFRLSRSYGPGRYDPEYEDKGIDYPYGYVRWTEQRNMEAFVRLIDSGAVKLEPLITHRYAFEDALKAYELVAGGTASEPYTGVVLVYAADRAIAVGEPRSLPATPAPSALQAVRLGVLGAGNFANTVVLPTVSHTDGVQLVSIASASGVSASAAKARFGFQYTAADPAAVLNDPNVNTVAILTRHSVHAQQVVAALIAGKHVFVEKPLCLSEEELQQIVTAYRQVAAEAAASGRAAPALMVGYNRRFAPFVRELKRWVENVGEPLMLNCRVNAGFIPASHWTQDVESGGGRLLGEGCHFIDLLLHLAGASPAEVHTKSLPDAGRYMCDNFQVTIEFQNGSLGTLTYVANGHKAFRKEAVEVFGGGLAARLDDYRSLQLCHGMKRLHRTARLRADQGHRAEWAAFTSSLLRGAPAPISFSDLVTSTRVTLAALRSIQTGLPVQLEKLQH